MSRLVFNLGLASALAGGPGRYLSADSKTHGLTRGKEYSISALLYLDLPM